MKITKQQLKQIIKEETEKFLREDDNDQINVGDHLQITISDDGASHYVEKIDPADFKPQRSYTQSVKALVKVEQVATELADDMYEEKDDSSIG